MPNIYLLYCIKNYERNIYYSNIFKLKMYRIPMYIKEENFNDCLEVFSPLYDSRIKLTDKQFINEYYTLKYDGCKVINSELENVLYEQGMLMSREEVDAVIENINQYRNNRLLLTIFPTEACNFRCVYCYEPHDKITMKKEMVEAIKTYLTNNINKFKQVNLSWFGGEPTLCKETILDISSHLIHLKNGLQDSFYSSMTTNGYLLDLPSFLEYYNAGIRSFQITIDGLRHDERRPLVNGKGTFDKIIKNLEQIKQLPRKYEFAIIIRHNILYNDEDYSWYDFLKNKFGNDNRFSILIRAVNDMGGESVKELNILSSENKKSTIDKHIEYAHKLGLQLSNDNMELSLNINSGICYASYKHHYAIRSNGTINKCTVALDDAKNQIGILRLNGEMSIDETKNNMWSDNPLLEDCYNCKKILSCMNGECPLNRMINSKCQCESKVIL